MSNRGSVWNEYESVENLSNKVFKAKKNNSNEMFVIKQIIGQRRISLENRNKIKQLNSEHYIKIIDIIEEEYSIFIIMELLDYDLENYLKNKNNEFSIKDLWLLLSQLKDVFFELNNKKIILENIQLSNILVSNKNNKINYKLANFNIFNPENEDCLTVNQENTIFDAPEFLNNRNMSQKSMIYNLGILIYYILLREYPYTERNEIKLLNSIRENKLEFKIEENKDIEELIKKMLIYEEDNRISFEDFYNDKFFHNEIDCKIKIPKKGIYEGKLKEGKREGKGKMTYDNGDEYNGEWENDKKNGEGIYKYANGDEYEGEWKNNKKNGEGIYKYANGDEYDGKWENDKKNGKGTYIYKKSNNYFIGYWKDDKKEGDGEIFIQKNKKNLKGQWKDNKYIKH